ncbi:hypothetical protein [Nocardia cyriacigeorgica]|uniref:Uncharacterized protein n=1 Tax=Nocardia cyriacigeorgica TaxID=135487 RepID=A0A4U8VZ94_9NOCA|nr:hypothetical protein [Nocardia cyriacigeorgica]MBF6317175.1 hypothetical protein [Nocardia cyriacigeorgica]MBF6514153.1 hypothetical protein [Nocardia cyriacigeorgica]MBF6532273.1 hypothetical protein [Nocardia cyriacigeorgica]VFA98095.1 Uncharacterised protein [Nocardia cyriacigeorgica]
MDSMPPATDPDDPDDLPEKMRLIADIVSEFDSEILQVRAFDLLVERCLASPNRPPAPTVEAGGSVSTYPAVDTTVPDHPADDSSGIGTGDGAQSTNSGSFERKDEPEKAGGRRHRKPGRRREPIRNIDFRPDGQLSFRDFVAEKQPTTIDQKNVVAVYWLEYVAEISDISVGHVLAAYKECSWREPANPDNALHVTASRFHWLDTHNMASIVVTPSGRNVVQYDMPIAPPRKR